MPSLEEKLQAVRDLKSQYYIGTQAAKLYLDFLAEIDSTLEDTTRRVREYTGRNDITTQGVLERVAALDEPVTAVIRAIYQVQIETEERFDLEVKDVFDGNDEESFVYDNVPEFADFLEDIEFTEEEQEASDEYGRIAERYERMQDALPLEPYVTAISRTRKKEGVGSEKDADLVARLIGELYDAPNAVVVNNPEEQEITSIVTYLARQLGEAFHEDLQRVHDTAIELYDADMNRTPEELRENIMARVKNITISPERLSKRLLREQASHDFRYRRTLAVATAEKLGVESYGELVDRLREKVVKSKQFVENTVPNNILGILARSEYREDVLMMQVAVSERRFLENYFR